MSDCWVTEEVFNKIQSSSDPRSAWRKYLGVWPDWNANGQMVIYDVKPGETLKAWSGPAASQVRDNLKGVHLEGGWEQLIFKVERSSPANDTVGYYRIDGDKGTRLKKPITPEEYGRLSNADKAKYAFIRVEINHPNITGPFETGWGYTDFGGVGFPHRIGLPALPGQITNRKDIA